MMKNHSFTQNVLDLIMFYFNLGSSIKYVRKIFRKAISNPLISTLRAHTYAHVSVSGGQNVSFSEHFAQVLNGWPLFTSKYIYKLLIFCIFANYKKQFSFFHFAGISFRTKPILKNFADFNFREKGKKPQNLEIFCPGKFLPLKYLVSYIFLHFKTILSLPPLLTSFSSRQFSMKD